MTSTLVGTSFALLAANGFDEHPLTEIQRALTKSHAILKTIAPETGVINGWQGQGWGHYFTVNTPISEALGSDFDTLILAGGERSTAKLKSNLHARRIINHFLEAKKPIVAYGSAVILLTLSNQFQGYNVAAPKDQHDELTQAGATVSDDSLAFDRHLLTSDGSDIATLTEKMLTLFPAPTIEREAA